MFCIPAGAAALQAGAQPLGVVAVTPEAKGPEIRQIALPPSFGHRHDVVGIPEAAAPRVHFELPAQSSSFPGRDELKPAEELQRIQAANRADSPVALEHLGAQISGIGPQPPLMNARVAAKGPAAFGDLGPAPSADAPAVGTAFLRFAYPAAGTFPSCAHATRRE